MRGVLTRRRERDASLMDRGNRKLARGYTGYQCTGSAGAAISRLIRNIASDPDVEGGGARRQRTAGRTGGREREVRI